MAPLSENESELLRLIYSETLRVEGLSQFSSMELSGDDREDELDLPRIGVRVGGFWIGDGSASRKARSRGLAKLQDRQLVTLHANWGTNLTHVKLTAAGRKLAEQLTNPQPVAVPLSELDL